MIRAIKLATLAVLAAWCCAPRSLAGQGFVFDPDRCWTCKYSVQHFAAGAGIGVGLQLLPKKFSMTNRVWKRGLIELTVGTVYELGEAAVAGDPNARGADGLPLAGRAGYGFSVMDIGLDMGGWVASELLGALVRKVL